MTFIKLEARLIVLNKVRSLLLVLFNMIYSSAVCERDERPGPIFTDGKDIKAWSDNVGEPKRNAS